MHNLRYILESELGVEHPVKVPPRIVPASDSGQAIPLHPINAGGILYNRRKKLFLYAKIMIIRNE